MSERKKIIPALLSLDRAAEEMLLRTPPGECLPEGAAGLSRQIDELSRLATELRLTQLTRGEVQLFSGPAYAGQDLLCQALELPLSRRADAQAEAQARPEESRELRGLLGALTRARAAGVAFVTGAEHGRRYVGGFLAYSCLRLVEQIEGGLRQGGDQQQELLAETAELRARVRAYLDRQAAAREREERKVEALTAEAEAAEEQADTARTAATLQEGGRPSDEALRRAAARLGPGAADRPVSPAPPAPRSRRRGPR